jgi:hypothetical protein
MKKTIGINIEWWAEQSKLVPVSVQKKLDEFAFYAVTRKFMLGELEGPLKTEVMNEKGKLAKYKGWFRIVMIENNDK